PGCEFTSWPNARSAADEGGRLAVLKNDRDLVRGEPGIAGDDHQAGQCAGHIELDVVSAVIHPGGDAIAWFEAKREQGGRPARAAIEQLSVGEPKAGEIGECRSVGESPRLLAQHFRYGE